MALEVDLHFRGVKANLRHADHERIPLVAIVGERERDEGVLVVHDMREFTEARVPRDDVLQAVQAKLGARNAVPRAETE